MELVTSNTRDEHPDERSRSWMQKCAHRRAEQDAELEPWKATQIREFEDSLCLSPTSHKQLFGIGVWHLWDFKDWLEQGNYSLAELYQLAVDEKMMRKVVAD